MSSADFGRGTTLARILYSLVTPHVKPEIPAFTLRLAAGLGLAEDPGSGDSFGMNRCKILAEGIVGAHQAGAKSVENRLRLVETRFAQERISLDKPFLNPGSQAIYNLTFHDLRDSVQRSKKSSMVSSELDEEGCLQATLEIGEYLIREALWSDARCTWLGTVPAEENARDKATLFEYSTLGPDLYGGTSGVALFLAELCTVIPTEPLRRTALGAMRQALNQVAEVQALGLYTGAIGVALASARIGGILAVDELLDGAKRLVQRTAYPERIDGEFDLLSGKAGTIVGLLGLREMLEDDFLLDTAVAFGEALLSAADRAGSACSWRSRGLAAYQNLTGFSHGASGAAFALLELFRVTGNAAYRRRAEQAFEYERSRFDANAANWPDFRKRPGELSRIRRSPSFAAYWCHGAPGIALSRLRAYQLLGDETYRAEAMTALRTTAKSIEAELHLGRENFSLCHGLAGNAVLFHGSQVLRSAVHNNLPALVASTGIERHMKSGRPWPCGTPGRTPSLMLGVAGIGYFYLRLCRPATPSILIITAEQFRST